MVVLCMTTLPRAGPSFITPGRQKFVELNESHPEAMVESATGRGRDLLENRVEFL